MPSCDHQWSNVTNCCHKCGVSKAHYEAWEKGRVDMSDMERSLRKRISQLLLEKQELVEFYGNPDNYERLQQAIVITEGNVSICTTEPPVMLDRGERARKAK